MKYKEIAIRQMHKSGIPASITLAQGCLESGNGNSTLARKGNNHFGIKCHQNWDGPTIHQDDDKKNECFRKYSKASDSYIDHSNFIRYRNRYSFLFNLKPTNYKAWAQGLKKAGYATDPKYANRLIKIIEDYQLYRYDKEVLHSKHRRKKIIPPTPTQLQAVKKFIPTRSSSFYNISNIRTLYTRNKVTYIIASSYDTYESIAKEYNLFTHELLRFNDLKENRTITNGTIIYLEKKRKRAQKYLEMHIAEDGDNYYDLAQKYAVRLSSIYKYNDIPETVLAPIDGEEIYLRCKKYR
ncbi:MAG: glucosaminidase domain-containing protein [Bacteroidales bacterium]